MGRTALSRKLQFPNPTYYHAFYYMWYANLTVDGQWRHWNDNAHDPASDDIASNYYPVNNLYSSRDPVVIASHMQSIKRAGIGTIVLSWWGQGSFEDGSTLAVMNAAWANGIKCAFIMEPYTNRTVANIIADIAYIYATYGTHPAFYRFSATTKWSKSTLPRGVFYIYDAYTLDNPTWAAAADAIRGTANDAILLTNNNPKSDTTIVNALHFDGLYPYDILNEDGHDFANCGTVMAANNTLWVPSVGPGFIDRRERNGNAIIDRNNGGYYDSMFSYAVNSNPTFISITSFNEWHEGTQLEPGKEHTGGGFTYLNTDGAYGGKQGVDAQNAYLDRTKYWLASELRPQVYGNRPIISRSLLTTRRISY